MRPAQENNSWGYRRVHGELLVLRVKAAASSTVWKTLREAGIDPAPDRTATTSADFLRPQANALLAADFIETVTLTRMHMYILAVIEHASRRIHILGATPTRPPPGSPRPPATSSWISKKPDLQRDT